MPSPRPVLIGNDPLQTQTPGEVTMYCCGVTPYDYCHLGHGRSYVVWDTFRRMLSLAGYDVKYVQNFTDIDDKIIKRSHEEKTSAHELAQRYITSYFEDMKPLGIAEADAYPLVTESIQDIVSLIEKIIEAGYGYAIEGDVYYDVHAFEGYGRHSGRNLEQLRAGARVEPGEKKRNPLDFALWKAAKPDEPSWDSPWGKGRPGWHIECSAMLEKHFGPTVDIHGGGEDLLFPHHANEIAQSECVHNAALANHWIHHAFIRIDGEKMSKSLGNFKTLRTAYEHISPMALRTFYLQTHYRSPIDFSEAALHQATQAFERLQRAFEEGGVAPEDVDTDRVLTSKDGEAAVAALTQDLNTPKVLSQLFELAGRVFAAHGQEQQNLAESLFVVAQSALGIDLSPRTVETDADLGALIQDLIAKRKAAKAERNFAEADRLRDEIISHGVELTDLPGGDVKWKLKG